MVEYYRRFVQDFSKISAPLTKLTRKQIKFECDDSCEQSFRKLKECLISAPLLVLPLRQAGFVIYYDASKIGFGYVLTYNGRVIAHSSRQLKKHKVNYPTHNLEM